MQKNPLPTSQEVKVAARAVHPKKYPYPIPENFGSSTGIYPISIPVKVHLRGYRSYPIPEQNTQHVGCGNLA